MFQKYQFDPAIATILRSSDKAFIVEYIRWSIKDKEDREVKGEWYHEDEYYMWDSYKVWAKRMPWIGESTVRKLINELRDSGWVKTAQLSPDPRIRTLFYTINKRKYDGAIVEFGNMHLLESSKSMCSDLANVPIPKTPTKTQHIPPPKKPKYDQHDFDLAAQWLEHSKLNTPGKVPASWTQEKFAEEISKTKRLAGLEHSKMVEALEFLKVDDFWRPNALSPASLSNISKANGNRKIINILNAMKGNRNARFDSSYDLSADNGKYAKWKDGDKPF